LAAANLFYLQQQVTAGAVCSAASKTFALGNSCLQFFNSKLGRMLCNSYSNRFCDFYIFSIVEIGAINFQSQKTGNPPLIRGVFLSKKSGKII